MILLTLQQLPNLVDAHTLVKAIIDLVLDLRRFELVESFAGEVPLAGLAEGGEDAGKEVRVGGEGRNAELVHRLAGELVQSGDSRVGRVVWKGRR